MSRPRIVHFSLRKLHVPASFFPTVVVAGVKQGDFLGLSGGKFVKNESIHVD